MSVVTVQVGQCGVQLGHAILDAVERDLHDPCADPSAADLHFRSTPARTGARGNRARVARAVLVDMEPKVVAACTQRARHQGRWCYPTGAQHAMQSGAGNNWALGYHARDAAGAPLGDTARELVRREAEACDALLAVHIVQSVAGGTGAGLGTRLAAEFRDTFGSGGGAAVVSTAVWPHAAGEVAVQSYNALLTMAGLADNADAVVLLNNDDAAAVCRRRLGVPRPSFGAMNGVLAGQLGPLLLPSVALRPPGTGPSARTELGHSGGRGGTCHLFGAALPHLVAHPGHKLLSLRSVPQSDGGAARFAADTWAGLCKRVRQMCITGSAHEEGLDWRVDVRNGGGGSAATWLLLRGGCSARQLQEEPATAAALRGLGYGGGGGGARAAAGRGEASPADMHARFASGSCGGSAALLLSHADQRWGEHDKACAALTNSSSVAPALDELVERAHSMFRSRAFVHQYEAHGVQPGDFVEAFVCLEQVLHDYRALNN
eukprot:g4194.t1